jgi:saccharopine dehydrogenase-like NADP-dependent oxidoreductase
VTSPTPVIAVIGGAGAMGRIVVRDLTESASRDTRIIVADRDRSAAQRIARGLPRRVRVVGVDVTRASAAARALRGAGVIVNACHHSLNLHVMETALRVGSHYCDLGGLFHVTRQQLRRDAEFSRAGLLAICGIGSAPGIVNVMARAGAERLDRIEQIHIAVGTIDRSAAAAGSPLATSYSIDTVLDEASQPAAIYENGTLRFAEPLSRPVPVRFPAPVGLQYPVCTIHSELATIPQAFRDRGVRDVSFRIAFPAPLPERLRFVNALGLASREAILVNGRRVVPREVLRELLSARAPSRPRGVPDEYEVLRVVLRGRRGRTRVEDVLDCHVPGMPTWGIGVDIDTGAPPSIVAQMILDGRIAARGVVAPESAVPSKPFFRALAARGMRVVRRSRRL